MKHNDLFGRLGKRADVDRNLSQARQLREEQSYDLEIAEDAHAETAEIRTESGKVIVFRALHKGGGIWLCLYNKTFYPK